MKLIKVKLTDICNPKQWKNLPITEMTQEGFPVYGANGIIGKYKEYNHEFPTIAITCRGATCGTINFTQPKSYITSNAMAIDNLIENIDQRFLYYALKRFDFQKIITGAAQPQITREGLSKVVLEIPEQKSDQLYIAQVLSKAETLIEQRKESIRLLDEFLKSTFLEMFGDPHQSKYPFQELQDIVKPGKIVTYGIVQAGPHVEDGVPYIKSGDIKNGKINPIGLSRTSKQIADSYKRSEVNTGDIIMSIRATVGTVALLPKELDGANLTQGTARISPSEKVDRYFLLYYIESSYIQRWLNKQIKGATFREITLGRLREMPIMIPPLALQNKFSQIVTNTEILKEQYKNSLIELEKLYGVLSQKAFMGEFS